MNNDNKFYNFNEVRKKFKNENQNSNYYLNFLRNKCDNFLFKLNLFRKLHKLYFSRTPESDSLYRRRNRLVILFMGGMFYYYTSKGVFTRVEVEIFASKSFLKKAFIPISKSLYFITCIFLSQIFIKYLYYLNKVFKSYQFALEGVLKCNLLENNYRYNDRFDIVDSENIKKNQ